MLTAEGHVKLIDFGTAKVSPSSVLQYNSIPTLIFYCNLMYVFLSKDMNVTDLNGPEFVGTPEYMAPEMIVGKPEATFSADLWTVGVILFQVISSHILEIKCFFFRDDRI